MTEWVKTLLQFQSYELQWLRRIGAFPRLEHIVELTVTMVRNWSMRCAFPNDLVVL